MSEAMSDAGHRLEEIGRALKVETAILTRQIANLLVAKKLKTKEQKSRHRSRGAGCSLGENP